MKEVKEGEKTQTPRKGRKYRRRKTGSIKEREKQGVCKVNAYSWGLKLERPRVKINSFSGRDQSKGCSY